MKRLEADTALIQPDLIEVVQDRESEIVMNPKSSMSTLNSADSLKPIRRNSARKPFAKSITISVTDVHGNPSGLLDYRTEKVYYLAYGSNLSAETFLGRRGIRPLSQRNVVVPALRLTFDLQGLPYAEPCFANTALRIKSENTPNRQISSEKTPVTKRDSNIDYHKDRWRKGLVGVVYELTFADFAHVIATEGGGASYQNIVVPCFPLAADPSLPVPEYPVVESFNAHTLFAPSEPPSRWHSGPNTANKPRITRPDPSYAQPSGRYLKLITTGAAEHGLPFEYRAFLEQIRPYNSTTIRQRLGALVFLGLWMPIIALIILLQRVFGDDSGQSPPWLAELALAVFAGIWKTYDGGISTIFGDGERTLGQ